jgi:hypothetical protein
MNFINKFAEAVGVVGRVCGFIAPD